MSKRNPPSAAPVSDPREENKEDVPMEIDNEMTFGDSNGEDELSVENLTKEVLYHYKKISKELFLENRAVSYLF